MYTTDVPFDFHAAWRLGDERLTGSTFTVVWHLATYAPETAGPCGELGHWLDKHLNDTVLLAPGDPLAEVLADDARIVAVEATPELLARHIYDATVHKASTPTRWLAGITVKGGYRSATYRPGPPAPPAVGACCSSSGGEPE